MHAHKDIYTLTLLAVAFVIWKAAFDNFANNLGPDQDWQNNFSFKLAAGVIDSMMGSCMFFFVICFFFSKSTFSKYYFRNTIRVSNSLDPD